MAVEEIVVQGPGAGGGIMAVSFDQRELVVVVFEAMIGVKRPAGTTAAECYAEIEARHPEPFAMCNRIAFGVLNYIGDTMRDAKSEPVQ